MTWGDVLGCLREAHEAFVESGVRNEMEVADLDFSGVKRPWLADCWVVDVVEDGLYYGTQNHLKSSDCSGTMFYEMLLSNCQRINFVMVNCGGEISFHRLEEVPSFSVDWCWSRDAADAAMVDEIFKGNSMASILSALSSSYADGEVVTIEHLHEALFSVCFGGKHVFYVSCYMNEFGNPEGVTVVVPKLGCYWDSRYPDDEVCVSV